MKKCKSNFLGLLWNDLKFGTKSNLLKFIIGFLFTLICCFLLNQITTVKMTSGKVKEMPGIYDFIIYILGGIKEYIPTKDKEFEVPFIWATLQLLVGFAVLTYPVKDLEGRGMAILVKSENRRSWWLSKCIWTIMQVMCIYIFVWIGIIISFAILGNYTFTVHQDICIEIMGVSLKSTSGILLFAITLPLLSSIMFALIQICLSLFMGPILSLALVFSFQVISAYVMNSILLGSYSMLLRNERFVHNGLNTDIGIIAEICLSIIAIVVGTIYFNKYDILEKE